MFRNLGHDEYFSKLEEMLVLGVKKVIALILGSAAPKASVM
jgi:hypothetical protein